MKPSTLTLLSLCAAALSSLPAQAQDKQQATASYKSLCLQAVDMPKPFGEYDLKDNPKLDAYCGCFGQAFVEHVMKADPKAKQPSADEATKRDLAIRNSCRKKVGLPLAK